MKQKRIKNISYRKFLDEGIIELISPDVFEQGRQNVLRMKNGQQKAAFLTILYYTGARPSEVLHLQAKHITKEGHQGFIWIFKPTKNSLPRKIWLPKKKSKALSDLFDWVHQYPEDLYLFNKLKSHYVRDYTDKAGRIREYVETTRRIRYFVIKAFEGIVPDSIVPYFFRHNRFSSLIEKGASESDIRMLKGAKSMDSVTPYLHLSQARAKKLSRLIE